MCFCTNQYINTISCFEKLTQGFKRATIVLSSETKVNIDDVLCST